MDPFLTIISATRAVGDVAIDVTRYIVEVNDAPESFATLSRELSSTQRLLEDIDRFSMNLQQKIRAPEPSGEIGSDSGHSSGVGPSSFHTSPSASQSTIVGTASQLTTEEQKSMELLIDLTGRDGQIAHLTHMLNDIQERLGTKEPETVTMTLYTRLLWPFALRQSKIEEYLGQLERYQKHLSLILAMIQT